MFCLIKVPLISRSNGKANFAMYSQRLWIDFWLAMTTTQSALRPGFFTKFVHLSLNHGLFEDVAFAALDSHADLGLIVRQFIPKCSHICPMTPVV